MSWQGAQIKKKIEVWIISVLMDTWVIPMQVSELSVRSYISNHSKIQAYIALFK